MTEVDRHIGAKLKSRRVQLRYSTAELARKTGLHPATIEAQEAGLQRVGALQLIKLCSVLDCPIEFFFEDLDLRSQSGKAPASTPNIIHLEHVRAQRRHI